MSTEYGLGPGRKGSGQVGEVGAGGGRWGQGRLMGPGCELGGTQVGPTAPAVTPSFLLPPLSVSVTSSPRNMWSAILAGRGQPSTAA